MNKLPKLNLRLFDNTNVTTDAGLSAEMRTYYHDRLIDHAEPKLVHDQFGQKVPIPAHGGKTIQFRKYNQLPKALTKLTEGVTPKGRKMGVETLTAEVGQYGDYIELSDMLELAAIDRNVEQATKMLGGQAGCTLDAITREVLNGGTNKYFAPKVVGGKSTEVLLREDVDSETCPLTLDVIKLAIGKLKRMNAEPCDGECYVAIIHPDTATDIMRDENWIEVHKYADSNSIFCGEIGKIAGCRFVETTEAKIIGPGYLFGKADENGVCRMTLAQGLDATGSTDIYTEEGITAEQAAELNGRIAHGEEVRMYVGGIEATITRATAGESGTSKLTASAAVKNVAKGAVICGYGAGKNGSAIYCTLFLGENAYGTTEIAGMGLQHIVKQLGSGGTTDPLNQRSTTGWKATKTAERLVEQYMLRVEHGGKSFGESAESN